MRRRSTLLLGSAAVLGRRSGAAAQSGFPNRPVRIIIPFGAGGGAFVQTRLLAERLVPVLGQQVLVDPRPGAGGLVATEALMAAPPDGYTIMLTTNAQTWMPALFRRNWHPLDDVTPLAQAGQFALVALVHKDNAVRWRTLQDLVAHARSNPDGISWGSSGIGGPQHLPVEQLMQLASFRLLHVPFAGNAASLQALLARQVDISFDSLTLPLQHVREGNLVALATTGAQRHEMLPDTPTVRETGVADFSYESFNFFIGPKGMSEAIQAFWHSRLVAAMRNEEFLRLLGAGGQSVPEAADNTIPALHRRIAAEVETYDTLVRRLDLRAG